MAAATGGVGKTTVALALAERLAALRADRIGLLDAHPLGGTAGLRVDGQRGLGLPALLAPGVLDAVSADGSDTAWSRWATIEHGSRVSVFGREQPLEGAELTIDTYMALVSGLSRHWPIMVVDAGAPAGRGVLQSAVVQSAVVLVVVCGTGHASVAATASWLQGLQVPPARRVGVVLPLGGGDSAGAAQMLASNCRLVTHLGVDRALAGEAAVPLLAKARPATRDACTQLAGAVMQASHLSVPREERR